MKRKWTKQEIDEFPQAKTRDVGHRWGEGFPYFAELDEIAQDIGDYCAKYGRIYVSQTKEKWGNVRVYVSFGYIVLPKWCRFDLPVFIAKGLQSYQKRVYKQAYKRAILESPHLKCEILCCADYPELLEELWEL